MSATDWPGKGLSTTGREGRRVFIVDQLTVRFCAVPNSFKDALQAEASSRSLDLHVVEDDNRHPHVLVVSMLGGDRSVWKEILEIQSEYRLGAVLVTDEREIALYRRAFSRGVGVVNVTSPPDVAIDVMIAVSRGELLASAEVVAACLSESRSNSLSAGERLILDAFANGSSFAEVVSTTFYSERHVRRLLNAVLAKAKTNSLDSAIDYFLDYLTDTTGGSEN